MKKTLIALTAIAATLTFAVAPLFAEDNQAVLTSATSTGLGEVRNHEDRPLMSNLEKIPSPDQIINFTNIMRQGNSLYGVHRPTSTASSTASSTKPGLGRQLEKIAAPWLLHQYEQIKKVGTALWGFKKGTSTPEMKATSTPKNERFITSGEASCVITAIKVKDTAVKNNNDTTETALNSAISTRTSCQETAINSNTAATATPELIISQRKALALCLENFRTSNKNIRAEAKTRHQAIWNTYRDSLRSCQSASSSESAALMLEDGGGNIFENLQD